MGKKSEEVGVSHIKPKIEMALPLCVVQQRLVAGGIEKH